MSIRDLNKLPMVAVLALAAACGGGGDEQAATTDTTTADASGTPTVQMDSPAAPAAATPTAGAPVTPDAGGQVHDVQMVTTQGGASGEFQPATISVKRGDVIRWTMADGTVMHNVSFTQADSNPSGFTPPADSPFLTQAGQTYELKIDWAPGTYNYVCVPHEAMGMKGSITVTE